MSLLFVAVAAAVVVAAIWPLGKSGQLIVSSVVALQLRSLLPRLLWAVAGVLGLC